MTYKISGEPDHSDVPKYLTQGHDFRERYLPNLIKELREELSRAKQGTFLTGLEGMLVPEQLFEEIRKSTAVLRLDGSVVRLTKAPIVDSALQITGAFIQRAQRELPPQYRGEAEAAIGAVTPKYVANVQEAAKALKVQLPVSLPDK
ncbi:hypothetical protein HYV83_05455 [Candidatus Woesearchaeota archaeon]|nr:hypothetical protein [Candidatus Woesearchaeota archaeon]